MVGAVLTCPSRYFTIELVDIPKQVKCSRLACL
jgi:hypothetical protein